MTEFKGENAEGLRRSRVAVGMWETGGRSPAGTKYRGGGLAGPLLVLPVYAPTWGFLLPRALSPQRDCFPREDLRTRGLGETAAGPGCESQCLTESPE